MNAQAKVQADPLAKLREPFPDHQISKLPKPTKQQTEAVRNDFKQGIRCKLCGAWHHPEVVHLDYVGHAALTDRLLDADPQWSWEPVAFNDLGLPAFDQSGGLWIKLTVCGVTRFGYGHAANKQNADPGAREKEVIGDALRNAAMRFGAALDLWHKGDLHADEDSAPKADAPVKISDADRATIQTLANSKNQPIKGILSAYRVDDLGKLTADQATDAINRLRAMAVQQTQPTQPALAGDILDDEIPY